MAESDCLARRNPPARLDVLFPGTGCFAVPQRQNKLHFHPRTIHACSRTSYVVLQSQEAELLSPTRRRNVAAARALLAYRMSKEIGLSGTEIGRRLHVTRSAVSKMIGKGRELHTSSN